MKLKSTLSSFFEKFPELYNSSNISGTNNLNWIFKLKLPKWLKEIYKEFPLDDLEISIPFDYGWEELKGLEQNEFPRMNTSFNTLEEIQSNVKDVWPFYEMYKKKYICICYNESNDGDGFFINLKEKDPKVIYVYHDCGEDVNELISNSISISDTFSEFVELLQPHQDPEEWLRKNEHLKIDVR